MERYIHKNIEFLELIFAAVYGTWLVSFLDRISFSASGLYLMAQIILIIVAFISFIAFFLISILELKHLSFYVLYSIAITHGLCICITGFIETLAYPQLQIKLLLSMMLGLLIFSLIFSCEFYRTTIARRR